jgi:hypothetical protein
MKEQLGYLQHLKAIKAENALIRSGICPNCKGTLERKLDARQAGPSEVVGQWYNCKCTNCGYTCDAIIPD